MHKSQIPQITISMQAPPGPLGLTLAFPIGGSPNLGPCVHGILPSSSMKSLIKIGDRLLSVAGRQITGPAQLSQIFAGTEVERELGIASLLSMECLVNQLTSGLQSVSSCPPGAIIWGPPTPITMENPGAINS